MRSQGQPNWPGKRSLTQRLGTGRPATRDVPRVAAEGTETPTAPLPHRHKLESLFASDLGGVQAHVGGEAHEHATAIGARAYAHGDHVVLPENPDLRTVAHEVTHVFQQRGGVQLDGGVGRAGDRYEQEANLAADAAVTGKPIADVVSLPGQTTSGAPAVQRDDDDEAPRDPISDAINFVKEFEMGISSPLELADLLDKGAGPTMRAPPFLQIDVRKFVQWTFYALFQGKGPLWDVLVKILGQSAVIDMAIRGRDETPNFGDNHNKFNVPEPEHFAYDLRARLMPLISDSANRLSPRYAQLRTALAAQMRRVSGRGKWPDYDSNVPQINPSQLVAARPIDHGVITALCEASTALRSVTVNYDEVLAAYPNLEAAAEVQGDSLRKVHVLLEIDDGLHNWLTVTEPAGATIEEVANEIYGASDQAYRLVRAGQRFGFPSPLEIPLRADLQKQWESKHSGIDRNKKPDDKAADKALEPAENDGVMVQGERDPVREILADPAMADVAIRAQSSELTLKDPSTAMGVLQRYSFIMMALARIELALAQLPNTHSIKPVIERTKTRADRIKNGDASAVALYETASVVQLEVVNAAASSLENLAIGWHKLTESMKDVKDIAGYAEMSRPYVHVTDVFADAAAASELPQTGPERLTRAQRAAQELPVEILEAMLSNVRSMLIAGRAMHTDPDGPLQGRGGARMDPLEAQERMIRDQLRQARELIAADPSKVGEILAKAQESLSDLQTHASIVLAVDQCDALIGGLDMHMPGWFDPTYKGYSLEKKKSEVARWEIKWLEVSGAYYEADRATDPADKKRKLEILDGKFKKLAADQEWKDLSDNIAKAIAHEEKLAKWVRIGIMIGIAIATMGAGSWALGVAEGFELGTLATGALVVGVETVTTTTLSQLLVDHPTLKGFFLELGENFLTFAVFRALSGGYRAFAGASTTATVVELVGFQLVQTVDAVHKANEASIKSTGHGLSAGEMFDVITENLVVAGATALVGFAGKRKLEAFREAGQKYGKPWMVTRANAIEAIDAHTIELAEAAKVSRKPGELYKALENERAALVKRQQLLDELLADNGKRAREAGLDPEALKTQRAEIEARHEDNLHSEDMLKLEPVSQGEFLYPAEDLPKFLERQAKPETKGRVEEIDRDPYTKARRYRVHPDGGEPFIVTEKLAGMGRVVGGLDHSLPPPDKGIVDLGDKPMFAPAMVEQRSHIRVGHPIADEANGLYLLRGLAEGDEMAFRRIGLEPPSESFNPGAVEWGLGRRGKEYIIIRGDAGSVNWRDFPNVEPIAHTHPFGPGKGIRGGVGEDSAIEFKSLLPGGGGSRYTFENQAKIFPSGADVVFLGTRGVAQHTVHTPYRIKLVNGRRMVTNPTEGGGGDHLSFTMEKPEFVGYFDGDPDIPVYKVKMSADAAAWEGEIYATDHPAHGSVLMFDKPPQLHEVPPGTKGPTSADPVTRSGAKFEPTNELERRANDTWARMKEMDYKGPKIPSFENDFLPMYREGWELDLNAENWKRAGTKGADSFPPKVTPEAALATLKHGDPFFDMLVHEKIATEPEIAAEVAKLEPAGRFVDAIKSSLKTALRERLIEAVGKMTEPELAARTGIAKIDPKAPVSRQRLVVEDMAKHLSAADRQVLEVEAYKLEHTTNTDGPLAVNKGENDGLGLAGDRAFDVVEDDGTGVKIHAGDAVLGPQALQEARDLLRTIDKTVGGHITKYVGKLRYVFASTQGAKNNLAFIEALLDGDGGRGRVEIDVFGPGGVRTTLKRVDQITKTDKGMPWLDAERHQSGYQAAERRVDDELHGSDFKDAAAAAGSPTGNYSPDHRVVIDAKGYALDQPAGRQQLVSDVVSRAGARAKQPNAGRQGVFVDLRGVEIEPAEIQRMRYRMVDESAGVIHPDDLVFVQGETSAVKTPSAWAAETLGTGADALLKQLKPAAARGLMDIPATEAKHLVDTIGGELVNAYAPTIGGKGIETEIELLGTQTATGRMKVKLDSGKADNVIDGNERLDQARTSALAKAKTTPMTSKSLVTDTNVLASLHELLKPGGTWAGLQPGQRSAINAVRVRNGLPMLDKDPVDKTPAGIIGTPDIRMPNVVLAERPEIPGFERVGVPLTVSRESPQYKAALAVFGTPPEVGGPGGAADRGVVADALFADTGGNVPEFMSKDELVYLRLARLAGIAPVNGSMKTALFPPGSAKPALTVDFTITVDVGGGAKKQLKVIAINNKEVPP